MWQSPPTPTVQPTLRRAAPPHFTGEATEAGAGEGWPSGSHRGQQGPGCGVHDEDMRLCMNGCIDSSPGCAHCPAGLSWLSV